jgi:hypothetical protein
LSSRDQWCDEAQASMPTRHGHLLEERQDVSALQLAANDHLAAGINPMNLENRLGDV